MLARRTQRMRVLFRALASSVCLALLVACGGGNQELAWTDIPPTSTPAPAATLAPTATLTGPTQTPTAAPTADLSHVRAMSPQDLLRFAPDEMGEVLILEYHVITTDPAQEAQFVRTADDFRADLQWLWEHNFHIVALSDVVNNTIDVPAGKYPVALTFDDGSSSQFRFVQNEDGTYPKDANGNYLIDPDCAVGVLEGFYRDHPDFGRGGHFAAIVGNGFSWPEQRQDDLFDFKVKWLAANGYEIGNHTANHANLTDLPTDEFAYTIADPQIYYNNLLGDVPGNASDILTLPYGTTPDPATHPDQRQMLINGFDYEGHHITFRAALLVGANPAYSPAANAWDPLWTPRVQAFDEALDYWFTLFNEDQLDLYVSDGDPRTITVPNTWGPTYADMLATDRIASQNIAIVTYDPETGIADHPQESDASPTPIATPKASEAYNPGARREGQ